tara:strand:+ start:489 stop:1094 length:606 start_codon:yes stop_codon:yes gene_type:complete
MSIKKVHDIQPDSFSFTEQNLSAAKSILNKYPENRKKSAVMPLLYLAQRQNQNWIPLAAIKYVAKYLSMPYIKVYEIATFYSMYNLSPVGKYFVQVCTTSPCLLRGADKITKVCKNKISPNQNEISKNGKCSWTEVECLGACVNAPMIQINNDYYEDLDENSTTKIIESLMVDTPLKPGSYRGRKNTSPELKQTLNGNKNA